MHLIPTNIKILKSLMSGEVKSPKDVAMETEGIPYKVKITLHKMMKWDVVKHLRYGEYIITDFGREYFKRIAALKDQGSGEGEK